MSNAQEELDVDDLLHKSPSKAWEAGRTDIRLSKLESTVELLKNSVLGMEVKLINKIDALIDSQAENTKANQVLTQRLGDIIDRFDKAIPLPTVNKLFALVFILVAGITGTLQLLDKLK